MVLVLGTNCGFVATAPVSDPTGGGARNIDGQWGTIRDTSSASASKITEVGWWANTASEETNYEVGLYDNDGAVVPGEAGTLLEVSRTNAKGTSQAWISASVDWNISSNKTYWIAIQCDDTATATQTDTQSSGGAGYDASGGAPKTTLPDPLGGGALIDSNGMIAIYAVVEESAGVTRKIKISGTFADKPIKTKVGGTFVDKPIKIKVGGTFQDA